MEGKIWVPLKNFFHVNSRLSSARCNFSDMSNQVEYYNHFGKIYRPEILSCPEPELWTTDYQEKGRVYKEMVERTRQQTSLVEEYFSSELPVNDAGCGFGRYAMILAKKGFSVTGFDSSGIFIEIANELFRRHNLTGRFSKGEVANVSLSQFSQIVLFDVVEHVKPSTRKQFLSELHSLSLPSAVLIVSLPHVKKRFTSQLNNRLRRKITQNFSFFLAREEHPYPIPTRKDFEKFVRSLFTILKFKETAATDYYVLRKL